MSKQRILVAVITVIAAVCFACGSGPAKVAESSKVSEPEPAPVKFTPIAVNDGSTDLTPAKEVTAEESETKDYDGIPIPEIVARIEDETISRKEFVLQMKETEKQLQAQVQGIEIKLTAEHRAQVLDEMIPQKIFIALARKAGKMPTIEEATERLEKRKTQLPPGKLEQDLKGMGITEKELIEKVREQMGMKAFEDEKLKDAAVTDEEVATEYELLKSTGQLERKEDTVDVAHILIMVKEGADPAEWDKAKEKIDAARQRIVGGEQFQAVASEVSEDQGSAKRGGVYPDMGKGKMVPEFDEKMFSTPVDTVTEPFKTKFGWHILTVLAKHEPGTMAFEEVNEGVRKTLQEERIQKIGQNLIEEGRESLKIEIFYKPVEAVAAAKKAAADAAPLSPEKAADASEKAPAPTEKAPASSEKAAESSEKPADAPAPSPKLP